MSGLDSASRQAAPVVSIGLPVFNGERYIGATIERILAQTFDDFELIICDNASTDSTGEICRRFAERDARIRYIRNETNIGLCPNFNKAFALSRGAYFKWQAHDDLIAPTYLDRLVSVLHSDPGCVLVHPRTVLIDDAGEAQLCYLDEIASDSGSPAERLATWLKPRDGLCNPVFGLMRREIVARTDLLPGFVSCDRVFLAHITLLGRCRRVDETLFLRRIHPEMSTLANTNKRDLLTHLKGDHGLWPVMEKWRVGIGYLSAVHRTPMQMRERLKTYPVLMTWAYRRRKYLLAEAFPPLYFNGRPTRLGRWLSDLVWPSRRRQS